MNRREFIRSAAAGVALAAPSLIKAATLTHKERVDRALRGHDLDRPPYTFYHHFMRPTAQLEAQGHLDFHRAYKTDIVKVMNDFNYPASTTGTWWQLTPLDSPYPKQIETLRLVRDGLNGDAYFIDTLYGPYMTAMILFHSQPEYRGLKDSDARVIRDLADFQHQHADQWHTALEAITLSTINHIRKSNAIGSSGALVSIFNARSDYGTVADYQRFSRAHDKRVLDALADTKLTILHLHNLDRSYLGQFTDFHAPVVQYSVKTSGIPMADVRTVYAQTLAGGVDEIDFQKLTAVEMRAQWEAARAGAGSRYIAMPGCSVPDSCTPQELARFTQAFEG
jgi:uroporphyrinogen decarboxylase